MKIKKSTVNYHGITYPTVIVVAEESDNFVGYPVGNEWEIADIDLWIDIVGDERLNSDKPDEPQDEEGDKLDLQIYNYIDTDTCGRFHRGEISEEQLVDVIEEECCPF